ncbi:MAG: ATP-dependent Clp protease proteolytic subunit [Dehalococcoidales bacterium]|nr:ATP-dependent Clp protease proteolytic subunit [Dehalococcoidales bacterium]
MEITFSGKVMELLSQLGGKMSWSYLLYALIGIVPILLYAFIMFRPSGGSLRRRWLVWKHEKISKSSVIVMLHRQTLSLLNFKPAMITLDDSQKILRALKEIPDSRPIHLILQTPGGMVIAAEQIARAIKDRKGEVHAYIPQYAMSGGTLIALACTKIHMGPNALIGPLDPQLSFGLFDQFPCVSLVKAAQQVNQNRDDKTLILADVAEKAVRQMKATVGEVLESRLGKDKAEYLAETLCNGNWTHDFGINLKRAQMLGIHADGEMPEDIMRIANTFPCSSTVSYKKRKDGDNSIRIVL